MTQITVINYLGLPAILFETETMTHRVDLAETQQQMFEAAAAIYPAGQMGINFDNGQMVITKLLNGFMLSVWSKSQLICETRISLHDMRGLVKGIVAVKNGEIHA